MKRNHFLIGGFLSLLVCTTSHATTVEDHRITSYNVCYTKLLRIDLVNHMDEVLEQALVPKSGESIIIEA